jgi:hypothetical protein
MRKDYDMGASFAALIDLMRCVISPKTNRACKRIIENHYLSVPVAVLLKLCEKKARARVPRLPELNVFLKLGLSTGVVGSPILTAF